jgi:hypothetical protein
LVKDAIDVDGIAILEPQGRCGAPLAAAPVAYILQHTPRFAMTPAATFRNWVLDPARTPEQLYPVELILATALHRAVYDGKCRPKEDIDFYEADLGRRAHRVRFRPCIESALLDLAADWWDSLVSLQLIRPIDRPVRDLALLRLLPQLTSINLDVAGADLAPLAGLTRLETLTLRLTGTTDLAPMGPLPALHTLSIDLASIRDLVPLGALRKLQSLSLNIAEPWPAGLAALVGLPQLEHVYYRGNLLPWVEVPALPALRSLQLLPSPNANTPLPSLAALSAAPAVHTLTVGAVAELAGVERFPSVETLGLSGPFRDLAPLARLARLAKLQLSGEDFEDLTPLLAPPRLRRLELNRQRGILLKPLYKATNLREVTAPHCAVLAEELAPLNEHLGKVAPAVYQLPAPRPLPPLRFIAFNRLAPDYAALPPRPPARGVAARAAAYGDDPAPAKYEDRWMQEELQTRLDAALLPGWGYVEASDGFASIVIRRFCDIELLPGIVQTTREAFALARFPWVCSFNYDLEYDEPDFELRPHQEESEDKLRAEVEEARAHRKARDEELKREHLARLGQEVPDPEDDEPATFPGCEDETSPFPDDELLDEDEEEFDERDEQGYVIILSEGILWTHANVADVVSHHLGLPPEDWHALPEPVDRRPRYW